MAGAGSDVFWFISTCFLLINLCDSSQICNGTSNQSSCVFPDNVVSDSCVDFEQSLLSPTEKDLIISIHSSIRDNLTKNIYENLPRASHLQEISWNESLAKMAQKWAGQCKPITDPLARYNNEIVGQNIAVADVDNNFKVTLNDLMSKWIVGINSLTPKIVDKYEKPKPGSIDYEPVAQMIWGNTSQLGCGRSVYRSLHCDDDKTDCLKNRTVVQLVCNYYPGGIKEGEPIYLKAKHEKIRSKVNNTNYNRIRNRMLELWPAAVSKASYRAMNRLETLFVFAFVNFVFWFK